MAVSNKSAFFSLEHRSVASVGRNVPLVEDFCNLITSLTVCRNSSIPLNFETEFSDTKAMLWRLEVNLLKNFLLKEGGFPADDLVLVAIAKTGALAPAVVILFVVFVANASLSPPAPFSAVRGTSSDNG